ncbi:GntR family transcriptional regulator (plasmid) [Aliirhizobium terrae]|uniref:GntR family transcriptional regulator n=1 Tax=Terrirhizobium terrae TaxID=2926709 RepID=UPI002577E8DB|nr:GntR family transcriptional regulator [Rhizobium sp. CC-CFT758]WJH37910.1 GntR family transcriptional regulator [Rhizobium sp. CC-CFT758]
MLDNDAYSSPMPGLAKGLSAEQTLRSAIVHCVMSPGEILSEAKLCDEFAIGRGAVRTALQRLQASGLVSASARSGWQVSPISAAEIREVIAARRHLERLLANVTLSEPDQAHVSRLCDMYAALHGRSDPSLDLQGTLRRAERDLLVLLAGKLGMPTVAGWLIDLWDRSARLVTFFEGRSAAKFKGADRALLGAFLLAGDRDGAEAHLAQAIDQLEAYLAARFLESSAVLDEPALRRKRAKKVTADKTEFQPNQERTRTN